VAKVPDELDDELEEELDEELELLEELEELELLKVFLLLLLPVTTGVLGSVTVLELVFLPPPPPPHAVKRANIPAKPHCLNLAAPKLFH